MYSRLTLVLTKNEMEQLRRVAQMELRRPRDQAKRILLDAIRQPTAGQNKNATCLETGSVSVQQI